MKIHGYCEVCRKPKRVQAHASALVVARGGVVTGTCDSCQEDIDRARLRRRGVL